MYVYSQISIQSNTYRREEYRIWLLTVASSQWKQRNRTVVRRQIPTHPLYTGHMKDVGSHVFHLLHFRHDHDHIYRNRDHGHHIWTFIS